MRPDLGVPESREDPPERDGGTGPLVLMVDDDPDVRTSVARGLRHWGFDVRVAGTGKEALRLLSSETHDALVLDVQMPELDGVAVVTALRALGNDIPICVLSARDTVNDRIAGLEAGADDYLVKPFDLGELVARLHALLRRSTHSDEHSDAITIGPLTIDTARRLVFVAGERAELTKREFDLLAVLAENAVWCSPGSGCWSWSGATTSNSTPTSLMCSSATCGASLNARAYRG